MNGGATMEPSMFSRSTAHQNVVAKPHVVILLAHLPLG